MDAGAERSGCLGDVTFAAELVALSCIAMLLLAIIIAAALRFSLPGRWGPGS